MSQSDTEPDGLPSVFRYQKYRAFLKDWYQARKAIDPTYSYSRFAKDGECSRSALANVIGKARTPQPSTLDAFARAMKLEPKARTYLGLLVELEAAPTQEARAAVIRRITATERYGQFRPLDEELQEDAARFYANWWTIAIYELVMLPGFREDADWIAQELHPPITPEQAQKALDLLFELDFIERTDTGIVQKQLRFGSKQEHAIAAIGRYNREVVPALISHLDTSLHERQHVTFAILRADDALVTELKARIHQWMVDAADAADAGTVTDQTRVYHLSAQLLPLSGIKDADPVEGSSEIT